MSDPELIGMIKPRLIEEIERLRERVKTLESMGTSESSRLSKLLIKERERIEELEDASVKETLDFGVEQMSRGHNKYHIITDAEIDAAWVYTATGNNCCGYVEVALRKLGFVRCDECSCEECSESTGDIHSHGPLGIDYIDTCDHCNGHGWRKE